MISTVPRDRERSYNPRLRGVPSPGFDTPSEGTGKSILVTVNHEDVGFTRMVRDDVGFTQWVTFQEDDYGAVVDEGELTPLRLTHGTNGVDGKVSEFNSLRERIEGEIAGIVGDDRNDSPVYRIGRDPQTLVVRIQPSPRVNYGDRSPERLMTLRALLDETNTSITRVGLMIRRTTIMGSPDNGRETLDGLIRSLSALEKRRFALERLIRLETQRSP